MCVFTKGTRDSVIRRNPGTNEKVGARVKDARVATTPRRGGAADVRALAVRELNACGEEN